MNGEKGKVSSGRLDTPQFSSKTSEGGTDVTAKRPAVYIRTFGWPLVTVARDGAGDFEEDKCFVVKELRRNLGISTNSMNVA